MRIATVSASSYKTYSWCEWQWFLNYCLGFRGESGPAALLGSVVHKYLEVMSNAAVKSREEGKNYWPDEEKLWDLCFNYYYRYNSSIFDSVEKGKIKKVIKGLNDMEKTEYSVYSPNTISSEAEFNIPLRFPECLIRQGDNGPEYVKATGKIDRVERLNEDTVEIIDYKTGTRSNFDSKDRKKIDSISLMQQIQPRMYHMAAKELYPWAKNFLVTFIYITDGGPVTSIFEDKDIKITNDILRDRIREVVHNHEPQRDMSWKCSRMCWFGKTGMCQQLWDEKDQTSYNFIEDKYSVLNDCKRNKRQ